MYKGLVFNVYNCNDKKQIKSKFNKFTCSIEVKEEKEVEEKVNYDIDVIGKSFCTNELNMYYDGNDKDIYFYCVDEVYVYGNDKMYTLNNFIKNNVSSLDNLLSNYSHYLNKNEKYYLYCDYGKQSEEISKRLNMFGYNTENIYGGYEEYHK